MDSVRYRIRLEGLASHEGTIPLIVLKDISEAILNGSEKALRLSVEGASTKRGKIPAWLKKPLELTFTGISKGSTVLEIEVSTLLESASEQVQQQDLWYAKPCPGDTPLTLLSNSVQDAISDKTESEHYDQGVLTSLLAFKPLFNNYLRTIEITSPDRPGESIILSSPDMEKIGKLKRAMKEPRAVVLSGEFNLIEHAERRFQLIQEDGHRVFGKVESDFTTEEQMRDLWGNKVTVKGIAYFNPSGSVRFIEAHTIRRFEHGEEIFYSIPDLISPLDVGRKLEIPKTTQNPLKAIWGKWPGEESIEDILVVLKNMSREN